MRTYCDVCRAADPHGNMHRASQPIGPPAVHFGEQVRPGKYGLTLTRDLYALPNKRATKPLFPPPPEVWEAEAWAFEDPEHTVYTDEWVASHREAALRNFDANMRFFESIPLESFQEALEGFVRRFGSLSEVHALADLDGVAGVYVMVLGGYRQVYIGQAADMRKRIRRHWSGMTPFDRLIFGEGQTSVLSIDSFRALDTTRIFAAATSRRDALEAKLVASMPKDYSLNRIGGGAIEDVRASRLTVEVKRRNLQPAPRGTTTCRVCGGPVCWDRDARAYVHTLASEGHLAVPDMSRPEVGQPL